MSRTDLQSQSRWSDRGGASTWRCCAQLFLRGANTEGAICKAKTTIKKKKRRRDCHTHPHFTSHNTAPLRSSIHLPLDAVFFELLLLLLPPLPPVAAAASPLIAIQLVVVAEPLLPPSMCRGLNFNKRAGVDYIWGAKLGLHLQGGA